MKIKIISATFLYFFTSLSLFSQETEDKVKNRFLLSYGANEWSYLKITAANDFKYENQNWRAFHIGVDFQRQFHKHFFYNVGLQYMRLPIRSVVTFDRVNYRDYFTDIDSSDSSAELNLRPQLDSKILALNLMIGANFKVYKQHSINFSVGLSRYWFFMDAIQNIQYYYLDDWIKQDPNKASFAFTINEPARNIVRLFNAVPFRLDYLNSNNKINYGIGLIYNWNPGVFIRSGMGFVFLPSTPHRLILRSEMNGSFVGVRIFAGFSK